MSQNKAGSVSSVVVEMTETELEFVSGGEMREVANAYEQWWAGELLCGNDPVDVDPDSMAYAAGAFANGAYGKTEVCSITEQLAY